MMPTNNDYKTNDLKTFLAIKGIQIPRIFPKLSTILIILVVFIISCMFLPWIQTSKGSGTITTLNPADRLQQIIAPLSGRVTAWYVRDGSKVKKGDKILDIEDIDPLNIERINSEITASSKEFHFFFV